MTSASLMFFKNSKHQKEHLETESKNESFDETLAPRHPCVQNLNDHILHGGGAASCQILNVVRRHDRPRVGSRTDEP